jgi:hypothetical protein
LLELLGDKWSLAIIRDMIFGNSTLGYGQTLKQANGGEAASPGSPNDACRPARVSLGQSEFSLNAFVSLTGSTRHTLAPFSYFTI